MEPTDLVGGELNISLVRISQKVNLQHKDGRMEACEIREMDGLQRDSFLNKQRSKAKAENGKLTIVNYSGLYSDLLSYCLYNSKDELFTEKEIQGFPTNAQEILHRAAQKINKMAKVGAIGAMQNIAVAIETQGHDPEVCLSIIKDISKNYESQTPGTMVEDKNGRAVPEGEN